MNYYLSIDLGTMGIKTCLTDSTGKIVSKYSHEYEIITKTAGQAEQDYEEWWNGFILGTKAFRDHELNGNISYGRALGYSVVILTVATLISIIYSYLMMTVIDPDMVNKIQAIGEEKMLERGMTDEQIEMAQKMNSKFMSPGIMMTFAFVGMMIFGTILALITSAFVKKEGDPYNAAMEDINEE